MRGETVKLPRFGTFTVRKKGQRIGRNPKTGAEVIIKPRLVLAFKASPLMKTQMNGKPTPVSDVQRDQANANPEFQFRMTIAFPVATNAKKATTSQSRRLSWRIGSYPLPQLLKFAGGMDCSTTAMGETD